MPAAASERCCCGCRAQILFSCKSLGTRAVAGREPLFPQFSISHSLSICLVVQLPLTTCVCLSGLRRYTSLVRTSRRRKEMCSSEIANSSSSAAAHERAISQCDCRNCRLSAQLSLTRVWEKRGEESDERQESRRASSGRFELRLCKPDADTA